MIAVLEAAVVVVVAAPGIKCLPIPLAACHSLVQANLTSHFFHDQKEAYWFECFYELFRCV